MQKAARARGGGEGRVGFGGGGVVFVVVFGVAVASFSLSASSAAAASAGSAAASASASATATSGYGRASRFDLHHDLIATTTTPLPHPFHFYCTPRRWTRYSVGLDSPSSSSACDISGCRRAASHTKVPGCRHLAQDLLSRGFPTGGYGGIVHAGKEGSCAGGESGEGWWGECRGRIGS